MAKELKKILIANRGEIASRIIRSLKAGDRRSVALYSEQDADLPFVSEADEAWSLGEGKLTDTYLNGEKIINIAKACGADAIHPGYGFLSENDEFAALCEKSGIVFIGPDSTLIGKMGNKASARKLAESFKVPVIPAFQGTADDLLHLIPESVYPLLIKPAAGGGGKGMKMVHRQSELSAALADAEREALNYFGSAELYIEKYIQYARHIEVQVLCDSHGNYMHLFERECTIQRRHQKVVEEAPSVSISAATRKELLDSALRLVRGIEYRNAGTLEYLMDEKGDFYFIEMNTRIQVEHPVTEAITGIDIVNEQVRIAEGKAISFRQEDVSINGHAIEVRLYSEDPEKAFIPSVGKIRSLNAELLSSRIDIAYRAGNEVSSFYDPMIAKVIAHGNSRAEAIDLLAYDLKNLHLSGIKTNRSFLYEILQSTDFLTNNIHTSFLDTFTYNENRGDSTEEAGVLYSILAAVSLFKAPETNESPWTALGRWRQAGFIGIRYNGELKNLRVLSMKERYVSLRWDDKQTYDIRLLQKKDTLLSLLVNGEECRIFSFQDLPWIHLQINGREYQAERNDVPAPHMDYRQRNDMHEKAGDIFSPIQGRLVKLHVESNAPVRKGDTLAVIESMKMENKILAPINAKIEKIFVQEGDQISTNKLIMRLNES